MDCLPAATDDFVIMFMSFHYFCNILGNTKKEHPFEIRFLVGSDLDLYAQKPHLFPRPLIVGMIDKKVSLIRLYRLLWTPKQA